MPNGRLVVKIVSWNLNRRPLCSDATAGLATIDVGLFQEAPRPATTPVLQFVPAADGQWSTSQWSGEVRTCIARFSDAIQRTAVPLGGANDVPAAGSLTVSVAGSLSVATLSRQGRELFTVVCAYAGWETPR